MKKISMVLVLVGLCGMGIRTLTFGQINPNCPNGCLTTLGQCYCYGTHAYKEAVWVEETD